MVNFSWVPFGMRDACMHLEDVVGSTMNGRMRMTKDGDTREGGEPRMLYFAADDQDEVE